jgi:hypothetical protein
MKKTNRVRAINRNQIKCTSSIRRGIVVSNNDETLRRRPKIAERKKEKKIITYALINDKCIIYIINKIIN